MEQLIVEEYRCCRNNVWRQWKKGKWQILHVTKICHLIFPLPFVDIYFWTGPFPTTFYLFWTGSFPATFYLQNVLRELLVSLSGDVLP